MSGYYEKLKSKNHILEVAIGLGFKGSAAGACYQGECPKHPSTKGKCLVIWPKIQGFKCYHCGKKGDVIDLVILHKNVSHKDAVIYLADRVKMPHLGGQDLTPQDQTQRGADLEEKSLVENILTVAAGWYHDQVQNFPDMVDHLKDHYGFSEEIIEELQIGFAPPGTSHPKITSDLASYLDKIPEFKGKLALSGLFTFKSPRGPFWDFFKGRIMFPYWKGGKVVYMTARATVHTPADKYECYTDQDENIKTNEDGNHQYIKYKKIRTHDPDNDKRKHISRFIQNDVFMGEDTVRGAKEIIITEGAPDWVSAVDYGFAAISPVTTNFREKDFEKLERLTMGAESVYIINDAEENQAGLEGALKTGKHLTKAGRNVYLVELPRPDGIDKIDLNEFFLNHNAQDLQALMNGSKTVLEFLIDKLPEDFPRALPSIKSDIAPILAELKGGALDHFIDVVRKKCKTNKKAIQDEIEIAAKQKGPQKTEEKEEKSDPEIEKASKAIANDPMLLKKRIDIINKGGVVGERRVIAMNFCALDSRLLPDDNASPNVLSIKIAGHFGAGKSYTLMNCLNIYPKSGYHLITNGSAKSIYYLEKGLKHKALVVTEAFQFQAKNAEDSEFVYVTRSLISEGCVKYQVAEKDENGKFITVEKVIDGPTSFITTTIMEKLEPQLEDRLFTIHPDQSVKQTRDIISMTADLKAGLVAKLDDKEIKAWKAYHESLKPVEIVISYAPKIAEFITQTDVIPITTRRAFRRVLVVIQTVACGYQYQRKRNKYDRVIAQMEDYWMALQIVYEAFRENLGQESRETEERISYIQENGPVQYKTLKEAWGITGAGITSWTKPRVREGVIVWCNEEGNEFEDDRDLKKAKSSGNAYLRVNESYSVANTIGLPTPYELTGDSAWDDGGMLLKKYDLKLDHRAPDKALSSVKGVLTSDLNTHNESEIIDHIGKSDEDDMGIKVIGDDLEITENNAEDGDSDEPFSFSKLDGQCLF